MRGRFATVPSRTLDGKWMITLEVDETPQEYDSLREKDLNIDIKEYRKRRSLNANAYFYTLVNKIAEALNVSDTEVHDRLLADNLSFVYKDGAIDWTVQDWEAGKYRLYKYDRDYWFDSRLEVVLTKPDGGFYTVDGEKPKSSKIFWHIKGSHQMDTKEMSRLIDATVEEAKGLGIETMTPAELERMAGRWKPNQS